MPSSTTPVLRRLNSPLGWSVIVLVLLALVGIVSMSFSHGKRTVVVATSTLVPRPLLKVPRPPEQRKTTSYVPSPEIEKVTVALPVTDRPFSPSPPTLSTPQQLRLHLPSFESSSRLLRSDVVDAAVPNVTRFRIKGTECLQIARPYAETTIFDKEARRAIKPEALRSVFRFVQSIVAKSEGRNANASRRLPFFPYYHWFRRMDKVLFQEQTNVSSAFIYNDTGRYSRILRFIQFERQFDMGNRSRVELDHGGSNFDEQRTATQHAEQLRQLSRLNDKFDFSSYGVKFPFWPSALAVSESFGIRRGLDHNASTTQSSDVEWREFVTKAFPLGVDHVTTPPAVATIVAHIPPPVGHQPNPSAALDDAASWSVTSAPDAASRTAIYSWGAASAGGSVHELANALNRPDAGVVADDDSGEFLAFTRFAQWKIARSQSLGPGETCNTVRVLNEAAHGFGLGADILMMGNGLAHAMIMNRILVPRYFWKWTDFGDKNTRFCTFRGFECIFLPPSACSDHDMLASARRRQVKFTSRVLQEPLLSEHILFRKEAFFHADIRWGDMPDLHPPQYTRKEVEDHVGMKYNDWASMQIFRYLMRGFQPWAEVMFLHMMRVHGDGYPWPQDETVVAVHVRNGEDAKNVEMEERVKCRRLDHSLQLFASEALSNLSSLGSSALASSLFVTFDDSSILRQAAEFLNWDVNTTPSEKALPRCLVESKRCIRTPSFAHVKTDEAAKDSRDVVRKRFGKAFLFRMSITNMLLSSSADAWVNNDASHWCKVMHFFARSAGSRRHKFPHVNIETLSAEVLFGGERDEFCRTRHCSVEDLSTAHRVLAIADAATRREEGAQLGFWPFPPERPNRTAG